MRLILVRHGETDGQSSIRYHGATDVPLSDLGREQMRRTAQALAGECLAAVYSSALSRSYEAARIASGCDDVRIVAGFNEIDFGEWEGLTEEEICARDPEIHALWRRRPQDFRYPGGESTTEFRKRSAAALYALLPEAPPGSLLLVLHKGVIRAILSELLPLHTENGLPTEVDLGSIHILSNTPGGWRAEALNRVEHLTPLGLAPSV